MDAFAEVLSDEPAFAEGLCLKGVIRLASCPTTESVVASTKMEDETITCLEMTSPTQLRPGRSSPAPIELEEVDVAAAPVIRSTYIRIWAPLASGARMAWSDAQWEEELSRPGVRAWVARVGGDVAGFVELEAEPTPD